jgi:hypothetical protein
MNQSYPDDRIQRLHDELRMPVGEFGALAAAVLMALSLMFVIQPLSKTERIHTTALRADAKSRVENKSRRTSANAHDDRLGVSSADALTNSLVVRNDAHSGGHS